MNRKPRSDSKLDNLTPESRVCELRDMLLAGASQKDCKAWLLETCGVTTTGDALTRFWKKHCKPIRDEERQLAAVKAEGIIDESGRTDWNAATLELVKQVSFEMMSGQKIEPKTAEKFIKLILKADAQSMDARKLSLLEANARDAKAKLEAATTKARSGGISEETLKELEEAAKLL